MHRPFYNANKRTSLRYTLTDVLLHASWIQTRANWIFKIPAELSNPTNISLITCGWFEATLRVRPAKCSRQRVHIQSGRNRPHSGALVYLVYGYTRWSCVGVEHSTAGEELVVVVLRHRIATWRRGWVGVSLT